MNNLSLTSINNSVFRAGNFAISLISVPTRKICNFVSNFAHTILGEKIIHAVKENLVEEGCFFVSSLVAAPVVKVAFRTIFGSTGRITGFALSLYGSKKTAEIAFSDDHLRTVNRTLFATITYIAISGSLMYVLPEYMEKLGENLGSELGQFMGHYAGGVLGAYCGLKLYGSSEVLLDRNQLLSSYTIKKLHSEALIEYTSSYLVHRSQAVSFLGSQVMGCLGFNSVDLFQITQKGIQGRLLEDTLPRQLNDPNNSINQSVVRLSEDIFNEYLPNEHYPHLHRVALPQILSNLPAFSSSCFQSLFSPFRALNHYFAFLNGDLEIRTSLATFDPLLKIVTLSDTPDLFEQAFANAKNDLIGTINRRLPEQFAQLARLSSSPRVPIQMIALCLLSDTYIRSQTPNMAKTLVEISSRLERRILGFTLSNEKVERSAQEFLAVHLAPLAKFTAAHTLLSPSNFSVEGTRMLYKNLIGLFGKIYCPLLGSSATQKFEQFMRYQIDHSVL